MRSRTSTRYSRGLAPIPPINSRQIDLRSAYFSLCRVTGTPVLHALVLVPAAGAGSRLRPVRPECHTNPVPLTWMVVADETLLGLADGGRAVVAVQARQ